MSENESNDGYVIEGNLEVAIRGHLVIYSVVGGRINYGEYSRRAQDLGLSKTYVPTPRRPKDAFAISKDVLQNMVLPTLDEMEGWDGRVQRKIIVKPLKKGNEYAVSVELTGRSRGRRHKATQNLFRISFDPPSEFNPTTWWETYADSFWDDEIEEPVLSDLRQCVSLETYWDDQGIDEPMLMVRVQTALLDEFVNVATSIDSTMLRNDVRKTLSSLGGLPFKSGSGSWFIPSYSDDRTYLETLENYSELLNYFGERNTLSGDKSQDTWYDENGAPRKWYRQKSNLRVMGYIDNERQLEYIKDDIQNSLSLEIAEYQERLLNIAGEFNEDKIDAYERKLDAIRTDRDELRTRLDNLSSLVGGIDIPTVPFSDISEGFESRLDAIGTKHNVVSGRLRDLMSLE